MHKSLSINLFTLAVLLAVLSAALGSPVPSPVRAQSGFDCGDVSGIPEAECEALVALYNATDGDNWTNNTSWLATNTPCNWYGVTCEAAHVNRLHLSHNNLSGPIPPEIGSLTALEVLNLGGNQLSGSILSEIAGLSDLKSLQLHWNQLSGPIPLEIGSLTALEVLNLQGNQLSGSIPLQIGELTALEFLLLSRNQLGGPIPPEIGNLSGLQWLSLHSNQLSGPIPPEIGNLTALNSLLLGYNVYSNQLSGPIPPEIGNLTTLRDLALGANQLSGPIPPEIGNLTALQSLWLDRNQLSGPIPPEIGNLTALQTLDLQFNQLSGELPGSMTSLTQLTVFRFNGTHLCVPPTGPVPAWLSGIDDVWGTGLVCGEEFSVSGRVTDASGAGIQGVMVSASAAGSASTDAQGAYEITGLEGGTYTLTPSKRGWGFDPPSRTVTVPPDADDKDFTGTCALSVSHIEVTQAIQDENNDVPLVAGKPAFVRVYVDAGEGYSSHHDITGALHGHAANGELSLSPLSSVNPSIRVYRQDDWTDQRGNLKKTLNFTLPSSWARGTITLTAEVECTQGAETVTFQEARHLNVLYVPIRDNRNEPDISRIGEAGRFAAKVYPTSELNYIPMPSWKWQRSAFCTAVRLELSLKEYQDCVKEDLKLQLTELYWDQTVGGYIFGWLPEGSFEHVGVDGSSDPTWLGGFGKAAFGIYRTDESVRAGAVHPERLLAHEIGHLLGARHTNADDCTDPDPDTYWPDSTTAKIGNYGVDGYGFGWLLSSPNAVKSPEDTYDYMSYCGYVVDGTVWTSAWTYNHIHTETLSIQTAPLSIQTLSSPQPYLQVRGLVFGGDTVSLASAWVFTPTLPAENPPEGTQYCLEGQDASATTLVSQCFDLGFYNYETGEPSAVDGFNLMLPYPSDLARIVLRKGSQELVARAVSTHAPVVSVLSPNGGETWSATGTYTITWTASDADDDPLTYRVLYSPDGDAWVPVGSAITETHLAVNAADLAGGSEARVRVMASDGMNTGTDESDAAFSVEDKAPTAYILAPEGEGTVPPGTPILLRGHGYDLEDAVLSEGGYHWSSTRDGDLGMGSESLVTLSPGTHLIILAVTDSDGKTGTATLTLSVGHQVYLPLVMRD